MIRGLEDVVGVSGDSAEIGAAEPQTDAPEAAQNEGRDSRPTHITATRISGGIGLVCSLIVFGVIWQRGLAIGPMQLLLPFLVF
ncbi:MAG: hypothetical protein QOC92_2967, partial [Acidimicrobiaceae bacterium]